MKIGYAQGVDAETAEDLPPELRLALAYTPDYLRAQMRTYFALDQRLSRIVSATTEPMLGQMRLAWWRDMFGTEPSERPSGDVVLEAVSEYWHGREVTLTELVDCWEVLIVSEEIGPQEISAFSAGRAAGFLAMFTETAKQDAAPILAAASSWAIADAASRVSDIEERRLFVDAGLSQVRKGGQMSRELRGLAVLEALSLRALKRGGRPLMEGRGAALTVFRTAILGR